GLGSDIVSLSQNLAHLPLRLTLRQQSPSVVLLPTSSLQSHQESALHLLAKSLNVTRYRTRSVLYSSWHHNNNPILDWSLESQRFSQPRPFLPLGISRKLCLRSPRPNPLPRFPSARRSSIARYLLLHRRR